MLSWVIILLIIAIVLGIYAFTGKGNNTKQVAKVFFFIALILFLVALGYYVLSFYRVQADVNLHLPGASGLNPFKN